MLYALHIIYIETMVKSLTYGGLGLLEGVNKWMQPDLVISHSYSLYNMPLFAGHYLKMLTLPCSHCIKSHVLRKSITSFMFSSEPEQPSLVLSLISLKCNISRPWPIILLT